jgi:hypothetical protein
MRGRPWAGISLLLATFVLVSCEGGTVAPEDMSLDVANGSTLKVALVVNGSKVDDVGVNGVDHVVAARLPALPWNAQLLSPSGRELLRLTVHAGDVHRTDNSASGDAARIDLSCGRIDLWSGPQPIGPMPGPGTPGDCVP